MILLDVLKMIEGSVYDSYYPIEIDEGEIDSRPNSVFNVTICFMCEEETWLTCNVRNEILIPWYDCEVTCFYPAEEDTLNVWLNDVEYLKKNYHQHLKEGKK